MYLLSIKFIGAFPDGNKVVELSQANGGGGGGYAIMVDNHYWGKILNQKDGWRVSFQNPRDEFNMGDLQELIDLVQDNEH